MHFRLLMIGILTIALSGCNNGVKGNSDVIFESIDIKDNFDQVAVTSNIDAEITTGQERSVSLKAESNLVKYITFETKHGLLDIKIAQGKMIANNHPVKVFISMPKIRYLSKHGPSQIQVKNINQSMLEVRSEGSGDIILKGNTHKLKLKRIGSGGINARELSGNTAEIKNYGSGDIILGKFKRLKPIIQGQGDIIYPTGTLLFDSKISGTGRTREISN